MEIIARLDGRAFPTSAGLIRQWAKARVRRTVVAGDRLLRRSRRHDLPTHGLAPHPPTGELV